MLLLAFARAGLAPCFGDVRASAVGAGIMGVLVRRAFVRAGGSAAR